MKEWQAESRLQSKRKAEEAKEGGEGSKKRALTNGSAVPVRPEDFWPAPQNDDDEFEDTNDQAKSANGTKEDEVKKDASPNKDTVTSENIARAEEDSDTEDDEIISLKPPTKGTSSPAKQESIKSASPEKTSSAIRQTVLLPTTTINKKRDRFGRSDF